MRSYPTDYPSFSLARIHKGQGDLNIRQVSPTDYTENLMVGYRQFDSEGPSPPLYCFGHGLSYAAFSYNDLTVGGEQSGGRFSVSFSLTNISDVTASEVVQLYIHPLIPPKVYRAKQELKGFKKILLKAGETTKVEFGGVSAEDLSRWDIDTWKFVSDEVPMRSELVQAVGTSVCIRQSNTRKGSLDDFLS